MSGELFRVVNPLPDAAQRNRCHTEKGSNDMLWDALNQIRMVFKKFLLPGLRGIENKGGVEFHQGGQAVLGQ